jgi:molybdopterin converting factor small subunit
MVVIKIKYFGMVREIVGSREESLKVDDHLSASEIIRLLAQKHGERFSDFVLEKDGALRSGFAYAINGASVGESKLLTTKCKEVHEFVILPPISGG